MKTVGPYVDKGAKVGKTGGTHGRIAGDIYRRRFHLPFLFRMNIKGGWISFDNEYYPIKVEGSSTQPLRSMFPPGVDLEDEAYKSGWYRIGYWQSYHGQQQFNIADVNVKRKFFVTVDPGKLDGSIIQSIVAVANFYQDYFEGMPLKYIVKFRKFIDDAIPVVETEKTVHSPKALKLELESAK